MADDFRDADAELTEKEFDENGVATLDRIKFNEGNIDDLDQATTIEYTAFMQLLPDLEADRQTPNCSNRADNPFRTWEQRNHVHKDTSGATKHTNGTQHSPHAETKVKYIYWATQKSGDPHPFHCLYGCGLRFDRWQRLLEHIRYDFDPDMSEHDRLKRDDGWYDADFYPKSMTDGSLLNRKDATRFDRPPVLKTVQIEWTHPLFT